MIINLWSEDQEGPVKVYGGVPREGSENVHQHCIYLAFCISLSLRGIISNGIFWSWPWTPGDRLIDPQDHLKEGSNATRHRL